MAVKGVNTGRLLSVMVQFAVLEFTSRAISGIALPGLPPAVPKVIGLSVNAGRLALMGKLTKGLPSPIPQLTKAFGALSLTQQALAIMPELISGFLSPQEQIVP